MTRPVGTHQVPQRMACFILSVAVLFTLTSSHRAAREEAGNWSESDATTPWPLDPPLQSPPKAEDSEAPGSTATEEPAPGPTGGSGRVLFNEFMLPPQSGEPWIEIYSDMGGTTSLDGWMISNEDGLTYQFGSLPDVPSGGYIVVHFDRGESETYFGQSQPNALHIYTGWTNVRWTRHVVDSDFYYARVAVGIDLIIGGGPEILANKFGGNAMLFYEPQADMTQEWTPNQIQSPGGTHRVRPIDVDSDGNRDLVYDYYFGNEGGGTDSIQWVKAPPGNPKNPWLGPYPIGNLRRPEGLDAGPINGDNLMDVVSGGKFTDDIFWYEAPLNPDGGAWIRHDIDTDFNQPGGLRLVDLDGDSDLDIVAVGSYGEEVAWYEHPVNPDNPWTKHSIAPLAGQPSPPTCSEFDATGEVEVEDIDGDGRLDVIVSEAQRDRLVWYRYATNPTDVWTEYIIDEGISGPSGLDFGDIDGDSDLDLLATATSGVVLWYPLPPIAEIYNPHWPGYIVDDSVHLAFYANLTDLDGDGDLDVTTADQYDDSVLWFENEFLEFSVPGQAALYKSTNMAPENIVDFVAWGSPAMGKDAVAVAAGIWQTDAFVDLSGSGPSDSIARDRFSTDTDDPQDWDAESGVDSDIPTPGTVNHPYPDNILLDVAYNPVMFRGGSNEPGGMPPATMPAGLCFANYSACTFSALVSSPFGWKDLEWVEVALDYGGANVQLLWTRSTDTFTETDPSDFITFVPEGSEAWTDGIYRWFVNFTAFFHWWQPSDGLRDVRVRSHNSLGYEDSDVHNDGYTLVRTLKFEGPMTVREIPTGRVLGAGGWVAPSAEIEASGPRVIYDTSGGPYSPSDSQFNVVLADSDGNSWRDYTSAGYPVMIEAVVPNDALTGAFGLTLSITDLPSGGIALGTLTHQLQVDADSLQYDSQSPVGSIWQTSNTIECTVTISDPQPGSGIEGSSIEYRVANGSIGAFGDWTSGAMAGIGNSMTPQATCVIADGPDNWVQWRAKDVAGIGLVDSPPFRIPVDTSAVTFHEFYPPPILAHQGGTVAIEVTIADFGGSGVNISSLQVSTRASGDPSYSDWYAPQVTVLNQSGPFTTSVASGPETIRVSVTLSGLRDGDDNHVRLRALDAAGNGYGVSPEFVIRVGSGPGGSGGVDVGLVAYWWLIVLAAVVVVLVAVTWLNKKRKTPPPADARADKRRRN